MEPNDIDNTIPDPLAASDETDAFTRIKYVLRETYRRAIGNGRKIKKIEAFDDRIKALEFRQKIIWGVFGTAGASIGLWFLNKLLGMASQ